MYNFSQLKDDLEKIKEHFRDDVASLRTGRANPDLVNKIIIDCYGSKTPLEHLASIAVEDAKTLRIQPWDKSIILNIEQGIEKSELGLRPVADKETLRITLPELTSERKENLLKVLKGKLEEARIAVRKARDDVWGDIQEKEREGNITEDEKFYFKEQMQDIINEINKELEDIASKKEKEITRND
jgi:ribosome recycling factor